MAGRPPLEPWYQKAAARMVREGKSLFQVMVDSSEPLKQDEAKKIELTKEFQRTLWVERNKYYNEIANEPSRTKAAAIGLMYSLVHKLMLDGDYKDALEGMLKLAKVEGWVGTEGNVNIFHEVTTKDLEEAKRQVEELVKSSGSIACESGEILPN